MSLTERHHPELLAPAGGMQSLRAAVASGADAVYLGMGELNARRGAENFTPETLAEACRFAHLRGVRVFLTANVVVLPDELEDAVELVGAAWQAGVDAVIVQDLGLVRAIRQALPQVRLHASTQIDTHSSATVAALAELGFCRITLARETSIEEIGALVEAGKSRGVEIESFVHGALCICYSGQCLLSSMIGGRSANRGRCAQPCRLPYELLDEAGSVLGDVGAHLLSPKDLAGITLLPRLVDAGVAALKIEGRMKSPEYVALVTGVYRGALDRAIEMGGEYEVRDGEMSVLTEAFSRGFTEAYLTGERGNDMMSYQRPNNRGVLIGRISSVEGSVAGLTLDAAVDAEDTVEVWTARGRFTQPLGTMMVSGVTQTTAPAGERVQIELTSQAGVGDRVFRVRNAALSAAAGRLFADEAGPTIEVTAEVRVVIGQPLRITFTDASGREGSAEGAVVERAKTRAVTAEDVAEHVGRLGGTPYRVRTWDIALSPDAGVGFSALHRVRREALGSYESIVLEQWGDRPAARPLQRPTTSGRPPATSVRLVAVVGSAEAAEACLAAGADEVQLATTLAGEFPADVTPVVPRVAHDREMDRLLAPGLSARRAVAGNLGALSRLAAEGVDVQAHWGLNAANPFAVQQLADMGARAVWLSPELAARQVALCAQGAPVPVGIGVAGRQELMVTEHCVLMTEGPCAQNCATCGRRRGLRYLKDRKGYRFPVATDVTGRTHVYNAVPLDLSAALDEVLATGVSLLRADLETESPSAAASTVMRMRTALDETLAGRKTKRPEGDYTSGHFFRGVD